MVPLSALPSKKRRNLSFSYNKDRSFTRSILTLSKGVKMKKLSRVACLVTALALTSLATADAFPDTRPYPRCFITCSTGEYSFESTYEQCCWGGPYQCPNGGDVWEVQWKHEATNLNGYDC